MSTQAVLDFTPAQASREAADSITDKQRLYRIILAHLERVGDATCDECEQDLQMSHQICSARFVELRDKGLIEPAGKRPTRSGRNAVVYRVAHA